MVYTMYPSCVWMTSWCAGRSERSRICGESLMGKYLSLSKLSETVIRLESLMYGMSLFQMHYLRWRETVEEGRRRVAVGANVLAVDQIAQLQIR